MDSVTINLDTPVTPHLKIGGLEDSKTNRKEYGVERLHVKF